MAKTYEDGLREGLEIARAEEAKWRKEASQHAAKYWGGMNSECARADIKRAKIAVRIADKITARIKTANSPQANAKLAPITPGLSPSAARYITEEAFDRAVVAIHLYQPLLDVVHQKLDAETAPLMKQIKAAKLFVVTEVLKVLPTGRTFEAIKLEGQYKMYEGRQPVEEL